MAPHYPHYLGPPTKMIHTLCPTLFTHGLRKQIRLNLSHQNDPVRVAVNN